MSKEMSFEQPMRECLVLVAKMKNVKLEHPAEDYDAETMLKMFKEMESMPIYRSPKERLIRFKDDVIVFFANIAMWVIRAFVFIVEKVSSTPECKEAAQKFRDDHNKLRKGKDL